MTVAPGRRSLAKSSLSIATRISTVLPSSPRTSARPVDFLDRAFVRCCPGWWPGCTRRPVRSRSCLLGVGDVAHAVLGHVQFQFPVALRLGDGHQDLPLLHGPVDQQFAHVPGDRPRRRSGCVTFSFVLSSFSSCSWSLRLLALLEQLRRCSPLHSALVRRVSSVARRRLSERFATR